MTRHWLVQVSHGKFFNRTPWSPWGLGHPRHGHQPAGGSTTDAWRAWKWEMQLLQRTDQFAAMWSAHQCRHFITIMTTHNRYNQWTASLYVHPFVSLTIKCCHWHPDGYLEEDLPDFFSTWNTLPSTIQTAKARQATLYKLYSLFKLAKCKGFAFCPTSTVTSWPSFLRFMCFLTLLAFGQTLAGKNCSPEVSTENVTPKSPKQALSAGGFQRIFFHLYLFHVTRWDQLGVFSSLCTWVWHLRCWGSSIELLEKMN